MSRAALRYDPATGDGRSVCAVSVDAEPEPNAARPGLACIELALDLPALHESSRWTVGAGGKLTRRPDDPPPVPRPDTRAPLLAALDALSGDATLSANLRTFAQRLKEHL